MYHYLEIIEDATKEVVARVEVTGQSRRTKQLVKDGMARNLNHNQFSIEENVSETELPPIS